MFHKPDRMPDNDAVPYSSLIELAQLCAELYKSGVTFYVNAEDSTIVITGF